VIGLREGKDRPCRQYGIDWAIRWARVGISRAGFGGE